MKSVLLQQVSRVLLPLSLSFGLALLLKGHHEPGGGFVAGLSLGMAGVLLLASSGRHGVKLGLSAERLAMVGVALLVVSLLLPVVLARPMLTHPYGSLGWLGKWHGALLFDVGVMLAVGGGLMSAARTLFGTHGNRSRERGERGES